MSNPVEPCPTCPEGWRPLDKEHCAACYEGQIEKLRGPLIELVIAYQDADSPAIQDTLRRARAALSISPGDGK